MRFATNYYNSVFYFGRSLRKWFLDEHYIYDNDSWIYCLKCIPREAKRAFVRQSNQPLGVFKNTKQTILKEYCTNMLWTLLVLG